MKSSTMSYLAIILGIVIAIVDILWIYQSLPSFIWELEGGVILVADLVWIYLDYALMKRCGKN